MNTNTFGSQLQTLGVLTKYISENKYAPTNEELATLRGLSVKMIYAHLRQLQALGYITRGHGWRNVQIVERVEESKVVPYDETAALVAKTYRYMLIAERYEAALERARRSQPATLIQLELPLQEQAS
jgi:hypothetical protein